MVLLGIKNSRGKIKPARYRVQKFGHTKENNVTYIFLIFFVFKVLKNTFWRLLENLFLNFTQFLGNLLLLNLHYICMIFCFFKWLFILKILLRKFWFDNMKNQLYFQCCCRCRCKTDYWCWWGCNGELRQRLQDGRNSWANHGQIWKNRYFD